MPGYEEHKMVGGFVGGATALVFALEQPPLLALAETLGGIVAGRLVANWPDVLEPAVSSHHRDAAHAVGPVLLAGKIAFQNVASLQSLLRTQAQDCFEAAANSSDGLLQLLNIGIGLLLHCGAGAVPAIPASYASHVVLDAGTPRGVPFLTRGF